MQQLDTRVAGALGVICLIALILVLLAGNDDDKNDPTSGWK